MNTIPTSLLFVLGMSICWGMLVAAFAWSLTPDEEAPERYGKIGITHREAAAMVIYFWLIPTVAALGAWWIFADAIETFIKGLA